MDAALKKPNMRRKKKDGIDLEQAADEEIIELKERMIQAAEKDVAARKQNKPAMYKLKMLPDVVNLLNRNTIQSSILDPDTNFVEAVKFFLEPLSDGSLPAYNIQRELFAALSTLPINTEVLLASGIGKVALFYTKSKRPELNIKRTAERLIGEWSRPILKRSDDYRKRKFNEVEYDAAYVPYPSLPLSSSKDNGNTDLNVANMYHAKCQPYHCEPKPRSHALLAHSRLTNELQTVLQGWIQRCARTISFPRARCQLVEEVSGRLEPALMIV
jgi:TFIIS helical bundle-like domain